MLASGDHYQWRPPKGLKLFVVNGVARVRKGIWVKSSRKHSLGIRWFVKADRNVWLQKNRVRRGNPGKKRVERRNSIRSRTVRDDGWFVMEGDGIVVSTAGTEFLCYGLGEGFSTHSLGRLKFGQEERFYRGPESLV